MAAQEWQMMGRAVRPCTANPTGHGWQRHIGSSPSPFALRLSPTCGYTRHGRQLECACYSATTLAQRIRARVPLPVTGGVTVPLTRVVAALAAAPPLLRSGGLLAFRAGVG